MYGAQAGELVCNVDLEFENDVEMYGAQAMGDIISRQYTFENDVEMYGAQAHLALGVVFL